MAVSRTAQYVALYRALEREHFRDPLAIRFLSRELQWAVRAARVPLFRAALLYYGDHRAPGARTSAIARTCYIDEALRKSDEPQVVLLGAGFDCRAHRLLQDKRVFEVDRAETQNWKRARVPQRDRLHYVAVDFLRDSLSEKLLAAGWDARLPTFFVWEGVTNYLSEAAVRLVLTWIGSTRGRALFTYVHSGVFDGEFEDGSQILANVRAFGEPWTFGLRPEELPAFVQSCGLKLLEDLGADDYRLRYLGRTSRGYAFYRLALTSVE